MKSIRTLSLTVLLISYVFILLSGCKKDEEDSPSIIGSWKIAGAVFNPAVDLGSGPTTDAYSLLIPNSCSQDDLLIFQEGGVYIEDEGATKCDTSNAQQQTSTYSYSGTTLNIYNSDTINFTNVSITSTTLKASVAIGLSGGINANVDLTLARQ